MTGVSLLSPLTEAARETDVREGVCGGRGVDAEGVDAAEMAWAVIGAAEGFGRVADALLLRLMIVVSSCLNLAQSARAIGLSDVKVKLCPFVSETSEIFNLT